MKYFIFACTVIAVVSSPVAATFAADAHQVDHHHAESAVKLQLDAGKKWETDPPLRLSMAGLRKSFAGKISAIYAVKLSTKDYVDLSESVRSSVSNIVAQCKLPPAADAQLHVIVGDLMLAADQMSGKEKPDTARNGAIKVIEALNNYPKYFNDPGFQPLDH